MLARWQRVLPVWLALLPLCFTANAAAQERKEPFPSISLVSGFAPGGGDAQGSSTRGRGSLAMRPRPVYDLTARLYLRHLGRFLAGKPDIVLKHRPGAGSLRAARWLMKEAPRDGATLVIASGDAWRDLLIGAGADRGKRPAAIGGLAWGEYLCAGRSGAGSARAMALGATAPRERTFLHARAYGDVAATGLRIVSGYSNTSQIALAFRRREIDGFCGLSLPTIRSQLGDAMARGELVPWARIAPPDAGSLQQVRRLSQIAGEKDGAPASPVAAALEALDWQGALDMALLAPPGAPQPRLNALRKAYGAMVRDEAFRREAVRWGLHVDPVPFGAIEAGLAHLAVAPGKTAAQIRRWSAPADGSRNGSR
jgi:hypothetical protein